jgi:hypothetical protein
MMEYKPLRWSISRMKEEFGIGQVTLTKRLSECGIEPEPDGCYSGRQVRALLEKGTPINRARLAKMEAETALAIAKTRVIEKEYLRRDQLELALLGAYGHVRRVIERSPLPNRDKIAIYRLLGATPEALMQDSAELAVSADKHQNGQNVKSAKKKRFRMVQERSK